MITLPLVTSGQSYTLEQRVALGWRDSLLADSTWLESHSFVFVGRHTNFPMNMLQTYLSRDSFSSFLRWHSVNACFANTSNVVFRGHQQTIESSDGAHLIHPVSSLAQGIR